MKRNSMNYDMTNVNFKDSMMKLLKYIKRYLPLIIPALLLACISAVFSIIGPDKLSDMTDTITKGIMTGIDLDKVKSIGIFLIVIYALSAIFSYLQGFIMSTVTNKCSRSLRREISEKINKLPLKYFDKTSYGDVLSRVTNDVDNIGHTLTQGIGSLVSNVTLLIGATIMMFVTNYIMAFSAIGASIFGFLFMSIILKKSQKYFNEQQKQLGNLNGQIEEVYSGHDIIKVYNGTEESIEEFEKINKELYQSAKKSQFLSGLMGPFMGFIGNFGYVVVCIVGALLVIDNKITFGVIVAFMIYVRLFTNPLSQIAQSITSLQSTAAASSRVFEFIEEEEMPSEENCKKLNAKKVKGDVEFKNVHFGYDEDKTIINDFSAKVKAGSKVAIVGPTGAGKTTMVNLLMKFYDTLSGDILIDNTSIKDLTRENIHSLFTMVLQDTWVFNGSIKENIKYNNHHIKDEDVERVCKEVGLHHFIKSFSGQVLSGSETSMKQTRYDTDLLYVQDISKVQKGENAIGMNCPNCGAARADRETHCRYCGADLEIHSETQT